MMKNIYEFSCADSSGQNIDLSSYKGKVLLIVNTASQCGFTPQYEGLENLQKAYSDDSFSVLAFPCNQFGGQEPGDENEIMMFCQNNFGVTFLLTEKVNVKGKSQHPLYSWLTNKKLNGNINSNVRWNFQKYIVSPDGKLINYFYSNTNPLSDKILSIINKKD